MLRFLTSSRTRHGAAAAHAQRGGLLLWAVVVLAGATVGALLVFYFVIRHLHAQLLVTDETLLAYVDQPLEVEASVLNRLDIELDEVVSTRAGGAATGAERRVRRLGADPGGCAGRRCDPA